MEMLEFLHILLFLQRNIILFDLSSINALYHLLIISMNRSQAAILAVIACLCFISQLTQSQSFNCTQASYGVCGQGVCANYQFNIACTGTCCLPTCCSTCCNGSVCTSAPLPNGTCTRVYTCPSGQYWSNGASSCQSCSTLGSSNCSSVCSGYSYYQSSCQSCSINYRPECLTCNSSQCLSCKNSLVYQSSSSSCVDSTCSLSYCIQCASSTTCNLCTKGHQVLNGICVTQTCSISNCILCSGTTNCILCASGYSLSSTGSSCSIICSDSYCSSCTTPYTCDTCVPGFIYSPTYYLCYPNCPLIGFSQCLICS